VSHREKYGGVDFEVSGETECVWKSLCSDELMDFEEPLVCIATQFFWGTVFLIREKYMEEVGHLRSPVAA